MKAWPKNHISGYISGTGSRRHNPFTLDLWPHFSFQTSPRLSKSDQLSPRKRCEKGCTHTHTHISDLDELSRMVYNTRGLRGSVQKSCFVSILNPFYRKRKNSGVKNYLVYAETHWGERLRFRIRTNGSPS